MPKLAEICACSKGIKLFQTVTPQLLCFGNNLHAIGVMYILIE